MGLTYTAKIGKKSIIEVVLDRHDGTISFWINGEDQGIAFTNSELSEIELYPAVRVSEGSKVHIMND